MGDQQMTCARKEPRSVRFRAKDLICQRGGNRLVSNVAPEPVLGFNCTAAVVWAHIHTLCAHMTHVRYFKPLIITTLSAQATNNIPLLALRSTIVSCAGRRAPSDLGVILDDVRMAVHRLCRTMGLHSSDYDRPFVCTAAATHDRAVALSSSYCRLNDQPMGATRVLGSAALMAKH